MYWGFSYSENDLSCILGTDKAKKRKIDEETKQKEIGKANFSWEFEH